MLSMPKNPRSTRSVSVKRVSFDLPFLLSPFVLPGVTLRNRSSCALSNPTPGQPLRVAGLPKKDRLERVNRVADALGLREPLQIAEMGHAELGEHLHRHNNATGSWRRMRLNCLLSVVSSSRYLDRMWSMWSSREPALRSRPCGSMTIDAQVVLGIAKGVTLGSTS